MPDPRIQAHQRAEEEDEEEEKEEKEEEQQEEEEQQSCLCHGNCYRAWRKIRCATLMKKSHMIKTAIVGLEVLQRWRWIVSVWAQACWDS